MLHYAPQHVSSSTLLILRRTNCITTASGIVTLCKQPYSMQVESGLHLHTVQLLKVSYDFHIAGNGFYTMLVTTLKDSKTSKHVSILYQL